MLRSNESIEPRLVGNQRMKKAPQSERAGALNGCAFVFSIGAVLLGAVLVFFGFTKSGIAVAVAVLLLSAAIRGMAMSHESSIRKAKEAEQKEREAKARHIVERVHSHCPLGRPLLVYLRSFAPETQFSWCVGMLGTWSIGMPENRGSYAAAVARRDFEGVIAKLAEPLGDLVTVGGEKTIGGGRIESSNEEWEEIVKSLCSAASVIFILPLRDVTRTSDGPDDGITKEVLLLKEQRYLWKTVFIMPPEIVEDTPDNFFIRKAAKKSPEFRRTADGRCHFLNLGIVDYWSAAREHFSKKNVELPPFRESGLAFFLADDAKQVHEICELTSFLPSRSEFQEWMMTRQRQAPLRIDEVRKKWGDSTWHDSRTTQIWPLLSHLLNLVNPIKSSTQG